jgi:hypothetical protein
MERTVLHSFVYPTFLEPPHNLSFSDQYAFRPTGSTTSAIVSLLQTVISLLQSNPYVVVISLDFSKAFDTVHHATLLNKIAELDLPISVHNWLVSFFTGHAHRTVYNGETLSTRSISASNVQESSLCPASYAVTAADLKPVHAGNSFVKFAEDTYLVVPADCVDSCSVELDTIEAWATENNLRLNELKTTTTTDIPASSPRRRCLTSSATLR